MSTTFTLTLPGGACMTIVDDGVVAPVTPKETVAEVVEVTPSPVKPKARVKKRPASSAKPKRQPKAVQKMTAKQRNAAVRALTTEGRFEEAKKLCLEAGWDPSKTDGRLKPKQRKAPVKAKPPVSRPVDSGAVEAPKASKMSRAARIKTEGLADSIDAVCEAVGVGAAAAKLLGMPKKRLAASLKGMDDNQLEQLLMEFTVLDEAPVMAGHTEAAKLVGEVLDFLDMLTRTEAIA